MEPEKVIKLFVGGVSHDTTEQTLTDYFSKYGETKGSEIPRDRITGASRGFGFVVFADSFVVERVLNDNHVILGKKVEVKVARPKGSREPLVERGESSNAGKNRKIFLGGIPADLTKEELMTHFEKYGSVEDPDIRHPRGFAFVTFDSEEAAGRALKPPFQYLKNKRVEVKVAQAKPKVGLCGNCGASMASPISAPYIPYDYYYGSNLNEWHGGFSYSSCYSHYNYGYPSNIFSGERQHRYIQPVVSQPIVIRLPPARVEQNEILAVENLVGVGNNEETNGGQDGVGNSEGTNDNAVHEGDDNGGQDGVGNNEETNGGQDGVGNSEGTNDNAVQEGDDNGGKDGVGNSEVKTQDGADSGEVESQDGADDNIPTKAALSSDELHDDSK